MVSQIEQPNFLLFFFWVPLVLRKHLRVDFFEHIWEKIEKETKKAR